MRITKLHFLILSATLFSGCDKKETPRTADQNLPQAAQQIAPATPLPTSPSKPLPSAFKAGIGKVLAGYLPVQQALAQDSFAKAKDAFMVMHGLLHTVPVDSLDSLTVKAWNDSNELMMEILHPMASSEDMASFREGFSQFSDHLTGLIDAFGEGGVDSLFQIHCPMAFENKGANWLQQGRAIDNPYFGKAMRTCGEVLRKINPT